MLDERDLAVIKKANRDVRRWLQGLECYCDAEDRCSKRALLDQLELSDIAISHIEALYRIEAEENNCGGIADSQKDTRSDVIMQREKLLSGTSAGEEEQGIGGLSADFALESVRALVDKYADDSETTAELKVIETALRIRSSIIERLFEKEAK